MKPKPRLLIAAVAVSIGVPLAMVSGQNPGFAPGGRTIVSLSFAGTAPGALPAGVRLSGNLRVVDKDGVRMLRASSRSELVLQLPEVLPQDFTLEFDLIPKTCCNPEDLSFEGTTTISQSSTSAHVLWHREHLAVVGGGDNYQAAMRADLRDQLPGQLVTVAASFEGTTVKLYTNGLRLFTLTDRRFVRGRVLRVFLGGQDDSDQAVYLARVRVATGPPAPVVVVALPATQTGTITPMAPPPPPPAAGRSTGTTVGPVTTTNPAAAARAAALAPPTPRTISLSGFAAAGGLNTSAPRTIALPGFAGVGAFTVAGSRVLQLAGFTGAGGLGAVTPRTFTLTGFTGTGPASVGPTVPASRTLALPGFTATGGLGYATPRSITLVGFSGVGSAGVAASRSIALAGFTGSGGLGAVSPRTIKLAGWTGTGAATIP